MPENKIKTQAEAYFSQGLNVVLLKDKKPLHAWEKWNSTRQTREEFETLPWTSANQYAFVCGSKLNNDLFLGVIDFDVKNLSEEIVSKGREALKGFPITRMEETPSKGLHLIYYSRRPVETVSAFHNQCALELLGTKKLCIMSPSEGYLNLNDNAPTVVPDLEGSFYEALHSVGIKGEKQPSAWFDREDLAGKSYKGKHPPCLETLLRGTTQGLRNEHGIRVASYLLNFRKWQPRTALKVLQEWNSLNSPTLDKMELENIAKSAIQGAYIYGCQDSVLQSLCEREACPIAAKVIVTLTEAEKEHAHQILEQANFLDYVLGFGRKRLIGEDNILLINFIELCSGQTLYPISGIVSGYSGSGKNESIRAIKPLIPEEWMFEFTTSTPEAVKYIPEEFSGTLLIYEAGGMQSKTGTLGLRAVGEAESIETIYPMRDEATGKMSLGRAKTNAKNFITTESNIDIEPDLYRQVLKQSMNPSYVLTKRVCAKELRDSHTPESLRQLLRESESAIISAKDFQNALRVQDWKAEVVVFAPQEMLSLIDSAVTIEQQVALRTQFKKILSFIKVLALLNQKNRVSLKIEDKRYVVASPEDYKTGLEILSSAILETVSRIEKRQLDVLELFTRIDVLDKNRVVTELKVSAVTAARALKTLARSGYLRENDANKPYTYEKIADKPNSLVILQDTSQYALFYEMELESFLTDTLSLVTRGRLSQDKIEVRRPVKRDTCHSDKTSDKMPNNLIPSLIPNFEKNPLVSGKLTRENESDKHE